MDIVNYVFGDFKTALRMDKLNKEDLKASVNVILTGLGAVGLEKVADAYANSDARAWLLDNVYAGHDTLLKYASMHGQQELANNILGLAPGQSTEIYAFIFGTLALGSAVAYHFKNKKADPANKLTKSDYIKAALYKPVSTVFAATGGLFYAKDIVTNLAAGVASEWGPKAGSTAKAAIGAIAVLPAAAGQKVIDLDGVYREAVDNFVDNAGNRIDSAKNKLRTLFSGKKEKQIGANDLAPEVSAYDRITHKSGLSIVNKMIRKDEAARVPVDTIYRKPLEPAKRQNSKATDSASYHWKNNAAELNKQLEGMGFFR